MFFFLSETEENLWILKILMRTTSGVWLPGCIPVGCFDSCVITGLTSFFERGNLTYVACPTIVRRKKNVSQKRLVFTFWPHLKYLSRESNYLLSVIFEEIEKLLERTQLSVVKDQSISRVTCSQSGKRFQQDIFKYV